MKRNFPANHADIRGWNEIGQNCWLALRLVRKSIGKLRSIIIRDHPRNPRANGILIFVGVFKSILAASLGGDQVLFVVQASSLYLQQMTARMAAPRVHLCASDITPYITGLRRIPPAHSFA